ncbi:hypothetical protein HYH02_000251 [Chlamydomonas schloesseri]|uniref:EF-hand domain-containing protein n=1 Tax=Chlamydomonas schloesseri TaxID=2026947 RepID=A0A835WLU7_9CHLO|nr:hypothetical protein HYH02_000251 [Chlamydomonas schloesseri]|eukprot:KAG2450149.1 hypothetical protein HYH02_000251 [Chlamydomonas schloesseri]
MDSPDSHLSQAALLVQRKKDKSLTWQPYLTNDGKQDLQELWERLDITRKGFITYDELHAAVNEAAGRTVSSAALQPLACRMDATTRQGRRITHADFTEYMAQQLLGDQCYQEALRAEQGPLLVEVGYKLYELLKIYKRKQMLKDAMGGNDSIKRLLTLAQVPVQRHARRRGQVGFGLLSGSPATDGGGGGGGSPPRDGRVSPSSHPRSPSRGHGCADLSAGHSPMLAMAAGGGSGAGGGGSPALRSKSFAFGSPAAATGTGAGPGAHAHAHSRHGGVQLVPSSPPLGAAAAAAAAAAGRADRSPSLIPRPVRMGATPAAAGPRHVGAAAAAAAGSGHGEVPAGFIQHTDGEWPGPEVEARLARGAGPGAVSEGGGAGAGAGAGDHLFDHHCHVMSHGEIEVAAARARQRRELRVTAAVGGAPHVITVCSLGQGPSPSPSGEAHPLQRPASAAGWLHGGGDPGSPGGSPLRSPVRRPGTACAAVRTVSTSAAFCGHSRTPQAAAVAASVGATRVAAARRSTSPGPSAGGPSNSTHGVGAGGGTGLGPPVGSPAHAHSLRRGAGAEAATTAAAVAAAEAGGGGGAGAAAAGGAVNSCASSAALSAPYGHYGGYAGGGNGGAGPLWRSNGLLGEVLHSLDRAGLAELDGGLQQQAAMQAAAATAGTAAVAAGTDALVAGEASMAAALASVLMSSTSLGSSQLRARQLSKSMSSRAGPAAGAGGGGGGGGGGGATMPARPHTSMAFYRSGVDGGGQQPYHSAVVAPAGSAGGAAHGGSGGGARGGWNDEQEDEGGGARDAVVAGWWGEIAPTAHLPRHQGRASPAMLGSSHGSSQLATGTTGGGGGGPGQRAPRGAPNFMAGTPSAKALYLDVSDSVEDDPLLAQLPNWIRKGIGLPPAAPPPPPPPERHPPGASPAPTAPAAGLLLPDPTAQPEDYQLTYDRTSLDGDISEVLPTGGVSPRSGGGGGGGQAQLLHSAPGSASLLESGSLSAVSSSLAAGAAPGAEPGGSSTDTDAVVAAAMARLAALSKRSSRLNMPRYVPFGGDADAVVEEVTEEGEACSPKHARSGRGADGIFATAPGLLELPQVGAGQGQGPVVVVLAPLPRSRPGSPARSGSPGAQRPRSRPGSASRFSPILGEPTPIIMIGPPPQPPQPPQPPPPAPAQSDAAATRSVDGAGGGNHCAPASAADRGGGSSDGGDWSAMGGLSFDAGLGGGGDSIERDTASKGAPAATPESLVAWEASVVSQRGSIGHGALLSRDSEGAIGEGQAEVEDDAETGEQQLLLGGIAGLWSGRPGSGRAGSPPPHQLSQLIPDPLAPAAGGAVGGSGGGGACSGRPGSASPHAQARTAGSGSGPGQRGNRGPSVSFRLAGAGATDTVDGAGEPRAVQIPDDARSAGCRDVDTAAAAAASTAGRRSAGRASPMPPFISGQRPVSPGGLPLAFQVLAAAEAAVAVEEEAEAEGPGGGGVAAAAWVLGDTPAGGAAAAAGAPAAVRLNRTALLRLSSQYGVELAEVAAAALGLSCTSPAAQAAVAQQLLSALSAGELGGAISGGNGGVAGGGEPRRQRRSRSPSPPARSPHGANPAAGRVRPRSAAAALGASSNTGRKQHPQPAVKQQQGGVYALPADALAASRRLRLGAGFVSRVSPHTHEAAAYGPDALRGSSAQPARPQSAAGHAPRGKPGVVRAGPGQDVGAAHRPRSALALAPPPRTAPSIHNTRTQPVLRGTEVASLLRATGVAARVSSGAAGPGTGAKASGVAASGVPGTPAARQGVCGGSEAERQRAPALLTSHVAFARSQSTAGADSATRG